MSTAFRAPAQITRYRSKRASTPSAPIRMEDLHLFRDRAPGQIQGRSETGQWVPIEDGLTDP